VIARNKNLSEQFQTKIEDLERAYNFQFEEPIKECEDFILV
jgi:hypothetical protein